MLRSTSVPLVLFWLEGFNYPHFFLYPKVGISIVNCFHVVIMCHGLRGEWLAIIVDIVRSTFEWIFRCSGIPMSPLLLIFGCTALPVSGNISVVESRRCFATMPPHVERLTRVSYVCFVFPMKYFCVLILYFFESWIWFSSSGCRRLERSLPSLHGVYNGSFRCLYRRPGLCCSDVLPLDVETSRFTHQRVHWNVIFRCNFSCNCFAVAGGTWLQIVCPTLPDTHRHHFVTLIARSIKGIMAKVQEVKSDTSLPCAHFLLFLVQWLRRLRP